MSRNNNFNNFYHSLRLLRASALNDSKNKSVQETATHSTEKSVNETVNGEDITFFPKLKIEGFNSYDTFAFGIKEYDEDNESVEHAKKDSNGIYTSGIIAVNGENIPVDKDLVLKLISSLKKFSTYL